MNTKGTCYTVCIIWVSVLCRHLEKKPVMDMFYQSVLTLSVCDSARHSEEQTEHLKELSLFLLGFLW